MFDAAGAAHDVPYFGDAAADGEVGELGGCEAAPYDEDVGFGGSRIDALLDNGIGKGFDLNAVTGLEGCGTASGHGREVWDLGDVGRADGEDDGSGVEVAGGCLVGGGCDGEEVLAVIDRDAIDDAVVDVFDGFVAYKFRAKMVSVCDVLAVVAEESLGRGEVVVAFSEVDGDASFLSLNKKTN